VSTTDIKVPALGAGERFLPPGWIVVTKVVPINPRGAEVFAPTSHGRVTRARLGDRPSARVPTMRAGALSAGGGVKKPVSVRGADASSSGMTGGLRMFIKEQ
jgi:hypothetical protein